MLDTLDTEQLDAVLAHETAHARLHHDLVIQPFVAWRNTFPFLRSAIRALAAVQLLVEILADDDASKHCDRRLYRLGDEATLAVPGVASSLDRELGARVDRLASPRHALATPVRAISYLAAVALVVVPPTILMLS